MLRGDKVDLNLRGEILSIDPLPNSMVKVRIAAVGSDSLIVSDGSGVIEVICKSGRPFS